MSHCEDSRRKTCGEAKEDLSGLNYRGVTYHDINENHQAIESHARQQWVADLAKMGFRPVDYDNIHFEMAEDKNPLGGFMYRVFTSGDTVRMTHEEREKSSSFDSAIKSLGVSLIPPAYVFLADEDSGL